MTIDVVDAATDEIVEAFARLIPQLTDSVTPPGHEALARMITSEATTLFVVRLDGKIEGALALGIYRIPTGVRAWIEDVVVSPEMRGRGVGQALVERALTLAREAGAASVELTSRPEREAANRLYQRLGFELRTTNVYRFTFATA
ncbi:MAG: GNAT family N-acetyltransferase [Rhodothermales bacterium]|nr:GNAT family N-acetyltransferase [Rhodothermales bacterium]